MYLSEEPSPELIDELKRATKGHIRSEKNLLGKPIAEGIILGESLSEESLKAIIDEVAQYDKYFAEFLRNFYFSEYPGGSLRTSPGRAQAAKNLLKELKATYPQPKTFSKSIGIFSFKEDHQRTVQDFVKLANEKYNEWVPFLSIFNIPFYEIESASVEDVEQSEILMDFIRKFPNVETTDWDYRAKIMSELSKIS